MIAGNYSPDVIVYILYLFHKKRQSIKLHHFLQIVDVRQKKAEREEMA